MKYTYFFLKDKMIRTFGATINFNLFPVYIPVQAERSQDFIIIIISVS